MSKVAPVVMIVKLSYEESSDVIEATLREKLSISPELKCTRLEFTYWGGITAEFETKREEETPDANLELDTN